MSVWSIVFNEVRWFESFSDDGLLMVILECLHKSNSR